VPERLLGGKEKRGTLSLPLTAEGKRGSFAIGSKKEKEEPSDRDRPISQRGERGGQRRASWNGGSDQALILWKKERKRTKKIANGYPGLPFVTLKREKGKKKFTNSGQGQVKG